MFKCIWCLFVLCAVAATAEIGTNSDGTSLGKVKITPQNISALFIGDLLRTKPKEKLEEAASAQQPVRVIHHYQGRPKPHHDTSSFNRKAHGGHDYPEPRYVHRVPEARSYVPVDAKTSAPVIGRVLSLRPVRLVAKDDLLLDRNSRPPKKAAHYEGDDCHKTGDYSYEARPYDSEERNYDREPRLAPGPPTRGYKSSRDAYEEDDRSTEHSSHSEPYRGSYQSKTHSSKANSQSNSGNSYSQSKSTSTSKTMTPNRVKQRVSITPQKFSTQGYERESKGPADEDQGVVVYKIKEPREHPGQSHGNYPQEYQPPDHESNERTETGGSPYTQYPSEVKGRKKGPSRGQTPYSVPVKEQDRPSQYSPYESDPDSYDQSTYSPAGHFKTTENYHQGRDYPLRSTSKEPEEYGVTRYQTYQDQEAGHHNEGKIPKRSFKSQQYSSHGGDNRESYDGKDDGSQKNTPPSHAYKYPDERYTRSYGPQSTTPSDAAPSTYQGNQQDTRAYEDRATVMDTTLLRGKKNHYHRDHKKQLHDPSRYTRSSGRYREPRASTEESLILPVHRPSPMQGRESKPYVSRSVSYSNNGENYQQPATQTEEPRQSMPFHAEKPIAYKPYNSEYPASYANDPLHQAGGRQHEQRHYGGPGSYERQGSYEDGSSSYRDDEGQSPHDDGDSYEQNSGGADQKDKGHHYVSKIEGYRDQYQSDVPLHLDDAFFEKYGISKKAKIIVAAAVKPHLLVADGSKLPEGGYSGNDEPNLQEGGYDGDDEPRPIHNDYRGDDEPRPIHNGYRGYDEPKPVPDGYNGNDEPRPIESVYSGSEEDRYEPSHEQQPDSKQYEEPMGVLKELPGSFDDLVDTNPKFLGQLPGIKTPGDSFFRNEDTFDDSDFHNVAHKGFVVSKGPREIVQQHGDGVSRILFNIPRKDNGDELKFNDEGLLSAASALLEDIIKADS